MGADPDQLTMKSKALHERLQSMEGAIVAFSGGVDSTALLAAALTALGSSRVVAVTADSESYPAAEKEEAIALAKELGVRHEVLETHELEREGYRQNAPDRCYFCKTELFSEIADRIRAAGLPDWPVLFGAIADDLGDHRPGQRAAAEHGVLAPLAEQGMSKEEVRAYSRERGLRTADKASFACLSSRVPYGTAIDAALLSKLDRAELCLRRRGFHQFRVRHHGEIARIEVLPQDFERVIRDEELVREIRELGYLYVCLDLMGFRSGSMNEALDDGQREA